MNAVERREYDRRYRSEHKEQIAAYQRKRSENPEYKKRNAAKQRKYRLAWPERVSNSQRKYQLAHPEYGKRQAAYKRKYRLAHPERYKAVQRASRLKQKYGIRIATLDSMKAAQFERCKICGKKGALVVDHNHETGRVRALLCPHCNRGLGMFGENAAILRIAAAYLESFGAHQAQMEMK